MYILDIKKTKFSLRPGVKRLLSRKGASAVEFALILPVVVLILFGIIEFGIIMYDQQVITNAAREGARAGIVQATPRIQVGDIATTALSYAEDHLISFASPEPKPTVNCPDGACTKFGDDLSVEVSYPYSFLVLPNFAPGLGNFTLTSKATMKCE